MSSVINPHMHLSKETGIGGVVANLQSVTRQAEKRSLSLLTADQIMLSWEKYSNFTIKMAKHLALVHH